MKYEIIKIFEGQIENEENELLTMVQLCDRCRLSAANIFEFIGEGIINPEPTTNKTVRFAFSALDRVRKAHRLQRDLELNLAGVALAMQLLDRIEELESKLKRSGYTS